MSAAQVSAPLPTSVIELLRDADAAAAAASGQVHIVSVSAIREALGPRWARRESGVADFVERGFRRGALADDVVVRLNAVDFILIQPSWSPLGALNRATQLMRDTLSYFLGEVRPENIRVAIVDELHGDAIQARAVAASVQPGDATLALPRDLSAAMDGSPPWERFKGGSPPSEPVIVRRPDGGDLEALFYVEPVWNVAAGAVASFLVQSAVFEVSPDGERMPPSWSLFTPRCHLALAERQIEYAAATLEEAGPSLVLHLPIWAACLRLASTRFRLLSTLRRSFSCDRRKQVILELCDLPGGFPEGALASLIAQVAPYARAVLVRTRPKGPVRGARGVVYEAASGLDDATLTRDLQRFCEAANSSHLAAAAYGLTRRSQILIARAAGCSHVAGPALVEAYGCELTPRRFDLNGLYDAADDSVRATAAIR